MDYAAWEELEVLRETCDFRDLQFQLSETSSCITSSWKKGILRMVRYNARLPRPLRRIRLATKYQDHERSHAFEELVSTSHFLFRILQ